MKCIWTLFFYYVKGEFLKLMQKHRRWLLNYPTGIPVRNTKYMELIFHKLTNFFFMCVNARWKCSTSDAVEMFPEQPYVSCCLVRSSAFRLYFHNYISVEIVFKVALKSESVWSRKQNFLRAAVASLTHRSALSPPSSYTVHGMCLLSLLDKQNTHRNRNISVIFFFF